LKLKRTKLRLQLGSQKENENVGRTIRSPSHTTNGKGRDEKALEKNRHTAVLRANAAQKTLTQLSPFLWLLYGKIKVTG
jgi:hypothetical protein